MEGPAVWLVREYRVCWGSLLAWEGCTLQEGWQGHDLMHSCPGDGKDPPTGV